MSRIPERTCIGCKMAKSKDAVVRIIANDAAVIIDYREKLPGRAAYVCPQVACIENALSREHLSRALHHKVNVPDVRVFIEKLAESIFEKIKALLVMSFKAGKLAAGYSAVHDAVEKNRVQMVIYALDLSDGTRQKITPADMKPCRHATLFTRDEIGSLLNRELVGVVAIEDQGLSDAVWREIERLKNLKIISE